HGEPGFLNARFGTLRFGTAFGLLYGLRPFVRASPLCTGVALLDQLRPFVPAPPVFPGLALLYGLPPFLRPSPLVTRPSLPPPGPAGRFGRDPSPYHGARRPRAKASVAACPAVAGSVPKRSVPERSERITSERRERTTNGIPG